MASAIGFVASAWGQGGDPIYLKSGEQRDDDVLDAK